LLLQSSSGDVERLYKEREKKRFSRRRQGVQQNAWEVKDDAKTKRPTKHVQRMRN
jgi:hypothetical protein